MACLVWGFQVAIDEGAGSESCKNTWAILLSYRHIWAGFLGLNAALEAAAAWSFLLAATIGFVGSNYHHPRF